MKLIIVSGIIAGALAAAFRKLPDPDLPWHLAVGRAVASSRSLLGGDSFSYTFPGKYVPYEYVSDLLLYAARSAAPVWGLHVLLALVLALLLRVQWLRRGKDGEALEWFALALSLIALGPWLLVRPATFGFPILAAELLLIERHRKSGDRRLLFGLIALQILWANVHGFAVLGAGIIALYALLAARKDRALAGAAVAATCLSSFGPAIFLGPLKVAGHERFIMEWTPATPELLLQNPALLLLMALAALAAWRSRDLFTRALLAGSLGLALLRLRLAPVFVVAAAPLLARELAPLVRGWRSLPALAAAAALAAPLGLVAQGTAPPGTGFDPYWLPVAACDFAEARGLRGPVWNNLAFGGYLIWRFPDRKVFIDGRTAHLYPPEFMEEAWRAEVDPAALDALDRKYAFAWAMTDARGGPFGLTLARDPRWAMVYLDDRAAIYVRRGRDSAGLAPEYEVLRHLTTAEDLLKSPPPLPALRRDVARALAQSPGSRHVQSWAAALAVMEKR